MSLKKNEQTTFFYLFPYCIPYFVLFLLDVQQCFTYSLLMSLDGHYQTHSIARKKIYVKSEPFFSATNFQQQHRTHSHRPCVVGVRRVHELCSNR